MSNGVGGFFYCGGHMDRGVEKLSFPFYAPYDDVLIKGVEEDGKWMVC